MKAILYVGAVLMTGASIYGFVDYKKTSGKLSTLYDSKEVSASQPDVLITPDKKEMIEKPATPAKPQTPVKAKKPAAPSEPVPESKKEIKISTPDKSPVALEKTEVPVSPETVILKENNNSKKIAVAKKRKVNYKMFSRGALDERYIEKKAPKLETRKGKIKE